MQKQSLLFTPGPLTTHIETKEAMLFDYGSRDTYFINVINEVRNKLLHITDLHHSDYEVVLMQGAGTFGLESVVSSLFGPNDKLLILINGAYGKRLKKIAEIHKVPHQAYEFQENEQINAEKISKLISENDFTHLSVVHCETTTGIINDIESIGNLCKQKNIHYMVDAMSSFGAIPISFENCNIDVLVSSSNKCIEGVPGFSFIIIRKPLLEYANGKAKTLSLDLYDQWKGLSSNGQFRFTPPVHAIVAFHKALELLEKEGGIAARSMRYQQNNQILIDGMQKLGFTLYLDQSVQGYIISSFVYPEEPWFDFEVFYQKLNERKFVIYPGKLSNKDCFRIGNIGQIFTEDIEKLLQAIEQVIAIMKADNNV
jgi:2-aminoethylphosphonate-pyruvate transaminase